MTRAEVKASIEAALEGGIFNNAAKGALEVATKRLKPGSAAFHGVSRPILPPDAGAKTVDMLMPVDLRTAKGQLQPLYDELARKKELTGVLQGSEGRALVALDSLLKGPDHAPLTVVDAALGDLKALGRVKSGQLPAMRTNGQRLALAAVAPLEAQVTARATAAGPEVLQALKTGRAATVAKYQAADVLDLIHEEPVKAVASLTAPKDAAIQRLRTVTQLVPKQTPELARAYLEDLLTKPQQVAEWQKLGAQTKAILFPTPGHAAALDRFFLLTKRISETNVNPSGSGYIAALGAQGAMLWYDPVHAVPLQIGAAALSKLLRSPVAVRALSAGLTLPTSAPVAMRAAATAKLLQAAQEAGVPLAPAAADRSSRQ